MEQPSKKARELVRNLKKAYEYGFVKQFTFNQLYRVGFFNCDVEDKEDMRQLVDFLVEENLLQRKDGSEFYLVLGRVKSFLDSNKYKRREKWVRFKKDYK